MKKILSYVIDDAKDAWKWLSVQMMALAFALEATLIAAPEFIRGYLPEWATEWSALFIIGVGLLGRFWKQDSKQ